MRSRVMVYAGATTWGLTVMALLVPSMLAGAQEPGGSLWTNAPAVQAQGTPAGGSVESHVMARHADLWANYCCQKRREHDPVRHYHPLVQLKSSLVPHACHHGAAGCGHEHGDSCGGHHHSAAEGAAVQKSAAPAAKPAQPPVPPVSVEPSPLRPMNQTPAGLAPAQLKTNPGDAPIEPAPEVQPVVVSPQVDSIKVPRNPLPSAHSPPPKRRVVPSPQTNPSGPPRPKPTQPQDPQIRQYFQID